MIPIRYRLKKRKYAMKMVLVLLFAFFMSNAAHASEFELKVYFNLAAAEKHDMVHCASAARN